VIGRGGLGSCAAGAAVALKFGDFRGERLHPTPKRESQIGNRFWIALGQRDELFPGGFGSAHGLELAQDFKKIKKRLCLTFYGPE
jgi:hypothetical protein